MNNQKRNKVYVIHSASKIESLFTLFPLIVSKYSHLINFIHLNSKEASNVEGECVILARVFKGNKLLEGESVKKREYIMDFKKRFNRVVMLDDDAGSDNLHFEYMDLVDLYYKSKLVKEKNIYTMPMYGRQPFTDYYNKKFGVVDEKEKIRQVPDDPVVLNKLKVSWNLGYGVYPMPSKNLIRLAKFVTNFNFCKALKPWFVYNHKQVIRELSKPVYYANKVNKVQARFSNGSLPNTVGFQRNIFIQKCLGNENILSGKVNSKLYNKELKKVVAVLSPFGWGEICFRDFETIINGSLLIKPNMDHIETWPDVYRSSETYIPIDWDGENLIETIHHISNNSRSYINIIEAARQEYKNSLLVIDNRVLNFLEEALDSYID